MTTVWKYDLAVEVEQALQMPRDAEILSVQLQGSGIVMWVRCVPAEKDLVWRRVLMAGTGRDDAPSFDCEHIGTVMLHGVNSTAGLVSPLTGCSARKVAQEALVWHFFDGGEVV